MTTPEGTLTAGQYEILRIVWDREPNGATVSDIWKTLAVERGVGRTTLLNLVQRLERRGWLRRRPTTRPVHYVAAMNQSDTDALLVRGFVDDFFEGSASHLISSLLGTERLDAGELERLRKLVREADSKRREETQ